MTLSKTKSLFIFLLFLSFNLIGDSLRVGISGSSPFRISGEKVSGISLDIWQEISDREKFKFSLKEYDTIANLIDAVNKGEVDVGIGPISITSARIEKVSFMQPYYSSHKALLARSDTISIFDIVAPFLHKAFFYGIGFLVFLLFIVGNLVRLAEKQNNPPYQLPYLQSVGNGMWLAIVTFTTVGYGDITVRSRTGRFIIASWMIVSMITASSLTAGIAASFTLARLKHSSIDSLLAMKGHPVAAIIGSNSEDLVKEYKGNLIQVKSIADGFEKIKENKADAFISDYPILKYNFSQSPIDDVTIVEIYEEKDNYGFCLSHKNPLLHRLNKTLLILEEEGRLYPIFAKWGL
ncbi:MAG TPA: transporter substrate-binding domain-containing protein [Leptospiraceae bacterium]|nr:transporter substrate-binding domain-containing protein [Leptospiraceae bacterium]HRG48141.1 transporter substrate-binding domain-containing protein [Leptospiraceae bacterium]HRG76080.1 transporter substrate-binding domain-containing protein [Leptospiraceae bacterium]